MSATKIRSGAVGGGQAGIVVAVFVVRIRVLVVRIRVLVVRIGVGVI